jgi:hypothetical protein
VADARKPAVEAGETSSPSRFDNRLPRSTIREGVRPTHWNNRGSSGEFCVEPDVAVSAQGGAAPKALASTGLRSIEGVRMCVTLP